MESPAPHGKVLTKGQVRVGIAFNPSGNPRVNAIKRKAAELIDLIEEIDAQSAAAGQIDGEIARLKAVAQTEVEGAAMWAVKAATKRSA